MKFTKKQQQAFDDLENSIRYNGIAVYMLEKLENLKKSLGIGDKPKKAARPKSKSKKSKLSQPIIRPWARQSALDLINALSSPDCQVTELPKPIGSKIKKSART